MAAGKRNIRRKLLRLAILAMVVAALVYVDRQAVRESRMMRYVGSKENPVDEFVTDLVGDSLKREQLLASFKGARDGNELLKYGSELVQLLKKDEKADELVRICEQIYERVDPSRDQKLIEVYELLVVSYAEGKRRQDAEAVLRKWKELAEKPKPDVKLLLAVAQTAYKFEFDDVAESTTLVLLEEKRLGELDRLDLCVRMEGLYARRGDQKQAAEFAQKVAELKTKIGRKKLTEGQASKISSLAKKGQLAEAIDLCAEGLANYPDCKDVFGQQHFALLAAASRDDKADIASKAAKMLSNYLPLPEKNGKVQDAFVDATMQYLFHLSRQGKLAEAMQRLQEYKTHAPLPESVDQYLRCIGYAAGHLKEAPVPVYRIAKKWFGDVTMDGRLDEQLYGELKALPGPFWDSYDDKEYAETKLKPTIYLWYTSKGLYVAGRFPEPFAQDMRLTHRKGDEIDSWRDDSVEIFFDIEQTHGPYLQWVTTPRAAYHLFAQEGAKLPKDRSFSVSASIGDEDWSFEMLIPMKLLSSDDNWSGRHVLGNIRRNRWITKPMKEKESHPKDRQLISWAKMAGGNHNRDWFYIFQFE